MLSNTAIVMHNIDQHGYLRTSQPAPAVRICADLYKLRRSTYTIPPLPLATSSMFRFCLSYQLHGVERADLLSAELIALVAAARKPTTTIKHTGYFTKWIQFASQRGRPPLPILPVEFAEFLIQSSRADRTASPTLNRCSAATFYCNLAAVPNPMEHPFCKLVKDALHRRLGIRGQRNSHSCGVNSIRLLCIKCNTIHPSIPSPSALQSCSCMRDAYAGAIFIN